MLVNITDVLSKAKNEKYAIPATNIDNENNLRAAIQAAENKRSPLILNVTPVANPDLFYFGRMCRDFCEKASVPVVLNLDHGKTFEQCMQGIQAGFTNIMIDRSWLPLEQNLEEVKEMVKMVHALGCTVEAELGHVGFGENYSHDGNTALTQVDEAMYFVIFGNYRTLSVKDICSIIYIPFFHGSYRSADDIHGMFFCKVG